MSRAVAGPSRETMQLLTARSLMHCEVAHTCDGQYLSGERSLNWSAHHRKARGMGGSRNPDINQPANLLMVCGSGTTGCHGFIESNRLWAYELGLLIYTVAEREITPAYLRHGNVRLDDAGSWTYAVIV